MSNKYWIVLLAACVLPISAVAQNSARDADIDMKLNAGALAGVAPPTGAQATAPAVAGAAGSFLDPYLPAVTQQGKVIAGQTDGKATVYEVSGDVTYAVQGSPVEKKLKKGQVLSPGDTVHTDSGATVSISFDASYKNAIRIPENSQAVLEGIEPTNIRIINGSVFSSVDGLAQGSSWKVTTPSTVAAVRGTLYLVNYQATSGNFFAATVNVPNDGKSSAIEIQQVTGDGSANVPEGKEINLQEGQVPDNSLVQDLNPSALDQIMDFFQQLEDLRDKDENSNQAPPTGGQGVGGAEGAGPSNEVRLDIQDLNTIKQPEAAQPIQEQPPVEEKCKREDHSNEENTQDN